MCDKKKFTKKDAQTALNYNRTGHRREKYRKENRVYYCEECNGWHLTSKRKYY